MCGGKPGAEQSSFLAPFVSACGTRPPPAPWRCRPARSFTPRYRRAAPGQPRPSARGLQRHRSGGPAMFERADVAPLKAIAGPNSSRGFILVAVLWIIAALATLASIYALYVRDTAAAFVGHN